MKKVLAVAALFLLLAGACALLRLRETTRSISADQLRFTEVHDATWDPATHIITRAGGDPYVYLELPKGSIPIREVTVELGGAPAQSRSNFYVYQFPDYLQGLFLNDSYAVVGATQVAAGSYTIRWRLSDSKVLRLDLPDDIVQPFEIRRVTLVSGMVGGLSYILMWTFLAFGLVVPLWAVLRGPLQRHAWLEATLVAVLIAAKLYAATDLRLTVIGNAAHDDALFVGQADAIMRGHWLGDFNERTLTKGPVYSLFLAAVGLSGLKLQLVQVALHAAACLALLLALRPLLPAVGARVLLFLLLLFDPHTLSAEAIGRVLRAGIQPALTLFVLAGATGLAVRITERPWRLVGWSVLAGLAFPLFWFSREEGVWLVPSLLLLGGVAAFVALRQAQPGRLWRLALLLLPVLTLFGSIATLRSLNARYYGKAMTIDVKEGAFPHAYGSLVRIIPAQHQPTVPVARETQRRAFKVSPAFAELEPYLEGDVGKFWEGVSYNSYGGADAPGEIRGGWYQWALREAAARAGHYHDAATADAYWTRIATEINAACDRGQLAAGPPRAGLLPRMDRSLAGPLGRAITRSFGVVVEFSKFSTDIFTIQNTPEQTAMFARVTHELAEFGWGPPTWLSRARIKLANTYAFVSLPVTIVAALALVLLFVLHWRARRGALEVTVLVAFAGGATALIFVVSLVDTTSFAATHPMYLCPATPLVLAIWVLAPYWAVRAWMARSKQ